MTVELACLDMAGTTVADDGVVEEAFAGALDAMDVGSGAERQRMTAYVRETMGRSKIEVFRALFPGEGPAEAANRAFEASFARLVAAGRMRALPGAAETIDRLRGAGIAVALTTGFAPETRDLVLDALGWWGRADLVLSPHDVDLGAAGRGRGRPYPDMILWAALCLGTGAVADVAVAGDTAADMEAGRRAGASVVAGVLTGADPAERLAGAGATHVLGSIAELPALFLE
jgi:phosphoglycolate phosphatase